MELKEIVKKIYNIIEDKKGDDIKVIDISKVSSIADLGKEGILPKAVEGNKNATWMLLDYRDIVVHIFLREDRAFYDLDRIWRDGTEVEI